MIRNLTLVLIVFLFHGIASNPLRGDGPVASRRDDAAGSEKKSDQDDDALTLEKLFPEKSLFGPSARATSFSADGKYGAYMYRPYAERRHGNDLYVVNTITGEVVRMTKVSILAPFQAETRKVQKDRIEKQKKKARGERTAPDPQDIDPGDPITGEWTGTIRGPEKSLLPPDGIRCTASLRLDAGKVSGKLRFGVVGATLEAGRFNKDSQELRAELVGIDSDLSGVLEVHVEDDVFSGVLRISSFDGELEIECRRPGTGKDEDSDASEENANESSEVSDHDAELGDRVTEGDADDKKAPRYAGIQTYEWHPTGSELLFQSGGDIYRCEIEDRKITRLTRTDTRERDVQYLPDGSGYTYIDAGNLMRVRFGHHLLEQVDPKLPNGESMADYRFSPDGKRLAFVAYKSTSRKRGARRVTVISYKDRFARAREIPRHVSDDPRGESEVSVYLYEAKDTWREEFTLVRAHVHKSKGPRDTISTPEWAPDSSRVTFSVFDQESAQVRVYEAVFPASEPDDDSADEKATSRPQGSAGKKSGARSQKTGKDERDSKPKPKKDKDIARVVHRFLHAGGPNTPYMMEPHYLWDSRRLVILTEQSGFRHLHVLDPLYEALEQVTHGYYEVYPLEISKDHRRMFVTATKEHPARRGIYQVDLESRQMSQLSTRSGSHSRVAVSDDGHHVLAGFTTFGELRELALIDPAAGSMKPLTDSHPENTHKLTAVSPEFFDYKNRHGHTIYGQFFKPADWKPGEKRPLLIYVYGGPLGEQKMVNDGSYSSDAYFFARYMAEQHGYLTATIDPRGASGYGGLFEKANYEQVGKPQVEDLVDGVKWFIEEHGVDPDRVGLHGWSFGGFQTQMCLYTEPDVFACGMAGAGPTEWENYNSWYSTGTIGWSREGHVDLGKFSLLPIAKNLKAKLLLIHGMEDTNVLYQDTVRVYRELLKAGKETLVELFLDPTGGHGLGGDVKRINRYRKYEEFLTRVLGRWEKTSESTAAEPSAEGKGKRASF